MAPTAPVPAPAAGPDKPELDTERETRLGKDDVPCRSGVGRAVKVLPVEVAPLGGEIRPEFAVALGLSRPPNRFDDPPSASGGETAAVDAEGEGIEIGGDVAVGVMG